MSDYRTSWIDSGPADEHDGIKYGDDDRYDYGRMDEEPRSRPRFEAFYAKYTCPQCGEVGVRYIMSPDEEIRDTQGHRQGGSAIEIISGVEARALGKETGAGRRTPVTPARTGALVEDDPSKLGHFHAALFEPPRDPDDVVYMVGYDSGTIDMARRMAAMEPELTWYPFTTEPHGVRATTLDGFQAYIVPKEDETYAWWVDSPRTGAVVVAGRADGPDEAKIAVEAHLEARAKLAPLAALVDHVLQHNPGVGAMEAVRVAKQAQRIAWQAMEHE